MTAGTRVRSPLVRLARVLTQAALQCLLGVAATQAMADAPSSVDPVVADGSRAQEKQRMQTGTWDGEYTDIDGHRARLRLRISESGTRIHGEFELVLSTEDEAERYRGAVEGRTEADRIVLELHVPRAGSMVCTLRLGYPAAHAEQAVFGVVGPVPSLNFGGGTLVAWKYRGN